MPPEKSNIGISSGHVIQLSAVDLRKYLKSETHDAKLIG